MYKLRWNPSLANLYLISIKLQVNMYLREEVVRVGVKCDSR